MILYLVVIIGTTSASQTVSLLQSWEIFKSAYGKKYENEIIEKQKFYYFSKNFQMIEFHNLLYERGIKSYQMGINQFADMTLEDALAKTSCIKHNSSKLSRGRQYNLSETSIPDHLDWRKKGYVTSVKDQGMCGSCWAFSVAGSLEGQIFKKSGKLISLSEQNLVDCDKENEGCLGGWVDIAFEYIKNHGIQTKSSYPYEGKDGTCRFDADSIGAVMTGYVNIPANDEKYLIQAITSVGPISIAIHAQRPSFLFYKSGIYDEPDCHSDTLSHSLLAVGYGILAGKKYYIVKNSWGSDWGDNGYILMSRNKDNQCGIAAAASYPNV